MATHRKLAPSSAHRWCNCPGSIALIGDDSSSAGDAAMRGTAAHKIIETMIAGRETDAQRYLNRVVLVKEEGDEDSAIFTHQEAIPGKYLVKDSGWRLFVVDEKMVDGVQIMIDEVAKATALMFHPTVYGERFLDMSWLDPRLGGTADVTLVEDFGWADLTDYKNGYVVVEVQDNEQLKTYAVGILHDHPDVEGVRVRIVQPNAPHEEGVVREESYTRDELKLFEIQLKEAADATLAPNAPRRVGDWCKWCPAILRCPEFESAIEEEARMDFADDPVEPLEIPHDNDELARKAKWLPLLDQWARDIEAAIQSELMNGHPVPGQKLVRGKANRVWINPVQATEDALVERANLAPATLYTEPKLKSPAQVEKLGIGKEQRSVVKKLVAELAYKPDGKITVALDNDPREAIDPFAIAAEAFAGEDGDEITSG